MRVAPRRPGAEGDEGERTAGRRRLEARFAFGRWGRPGEVAERVPTSITAAHGMSGILRARSFHGDRLEHRGVLGSSHALRAGVPKLETRNVVEQFVTGESARGRRCRDDGRLLDEPRDMTIDQPMARFHLQKTKVIVGRLSHPSARQSYFEESRSYAA